MPVQRSGRRFQSEAQRKLLWRNHPEVAEKWTREEEEAGIQDHKNPVEKIHPEVRINPRTGKEEKMPSTTSRRSSSSNRSSRTGQSRSRRRTSMAADDGNGTTRRRSTTRPRSGRSNYHEMTREELREHARGSGIESWYRMGKDELADELSRL